MKLSKQKTLVKMKALQMGGIPQSVKILRCLNHCRAMAYMLFWDNNPGSFITSFKPVASPYPLARHISKLAKGRLRA
jgi:hypothetical protein